MMIHHDNAKHIRVMKERKNAHQCPPNTVNGSPELAQLSTRPCTPCTPYVSLIEVHLHLHVPQHPMHPFPLPLPQPHPRTKVPTEAKGSLKVCTATSTKEGMVNPVPSPSATPLASDTRLGPSLQLEP